MSEYTGKRNKVVAKSSAFVLMNIDLGKESEVIGELRSLRNVKDVYLVYGAYDIVAKVEADTLEELKETINRQIRRLDKVRSTQTMLSME